MTRIGGMTEDMIEIEEMIEIGEMTEVMIGTEEMIEAMMIETGEIIEDTTGIEGMRGDTIGIEDDRGYD